jgi:hypothetical protein
MHIGILAVHTPLIASFSDPYSGRLIAAIRFHLIQQLFTRIKELGLFPFFKEFLMFLSPISYKQATASRDLETAGGVLVSTHFA